MRGTPLSSDPIIYTSLVNLTDHAHLHRLHFPDKHTGIFDAQTSSTGLCALIQSHPSQYIQVAIGTTFFFSLQEEAPRVHLQLWIQEAFRASVLPVPICMDGSCSIIQPGSLECLPCASFIGMMRLRVRPPADPSASSRVDRTRDHAVRCVR